MNRKNLILVFTVVMIIGCKKISTDQGVTGNRQMNDLKVPAAFSWATSRNIEFLITSSYSGVITITSDDGMILFHQGFNDLLNPPYLANINLPSYIQKVRVNGVQVPLTGNTVNVTLAGPGAGLKSQPESPLYQVPLDGLVASWNFDENTGCIAHDIQGQHDGTVTGGTWVPGIHGSALTFDGVSGHVQVPDNASINLTGNKISFSVWFKLSQVGSNGAFIYQNVKYLVKIDPQGIVSFSAYTPVWFSVVVPWTERILNTDWHHVAATYDGATMKIYLDGNLKISGNNTGNLQSSVSDVYIGNQNLINPFKGTLDEVLLYNRTLSDAEIQLIYSSTPNPGNGSSYLISAWNLNENGGTIVTDAVGTNNGTLTGATWAAGYSGSCLHFNGTSDNVNIPNAANLNPVSAITMMVWAKTEESRSAKIFEKGDLDGHGIGEDPYTGWQGGVRLDNNTSQLVDWGGGVPLLNQWYHIAMTYDGTTLNLFVNGQLRNSKAATGKLMVNARSLSLGSDNAQQKFFKGSVDEVKIFNKALTQTEIQANYTAQGTPTDSDGDGVPDASDSYPHDPARAFDNYFPATGFATIAFEDLWPGKGDYDFNDLVVDYRFKAVTSASNKVTEITGTFAIRAIGAGLSNGFGFQLPGSSLQQADIQVQGQKLLEHYITLNANGTEANQQKATVIVFDNVNKIMQNTSGFGVNTDPGLPYINPDTTIISMIFTPGKYTLDDIGLTGFNPFLIVNQERGKEIHQPDYPPTSLVNTAYFGTAQDASNPAVGKYYKTANNLPWAITISSSFSYTIETKQITSAYLMFATWAESSGTLYPDWYLNNPGYRDESNIYSKP